MNECKHCGKPVHEGYVLCHECRWKEQWPESVLNSPETADRLKRSQSTHILSFDREKPEAIFSATTARNRTTYITDIESCTCRDFEINHRKIPCKHILRLGAELGLFRNRNREILPEVLHNADDELIEKYLMILRLIIKGRKIRIKRLENESAADSNKLQAYYEFTGEAREIRQYKYKDDKDVLLDGLIKLGLIEGIETEEKKTITVKLPDDMTLEHIERILEVYGENLPSITHKVSKSPLELLSEIENSGRRSEEILRCSDAADTSDWAYHVPRCFNDALDIKLLMRTKNYVEYYVWTQGANFAFDAGDVIYRDNASYENGTPALQVISAIRANESYHGEIRYRDFESGEEKMKTQTDFVRMLICD